LHRPSRLGLARPRTLVFRARSHRLIAEVFKLGFLMRYALGSQALIGAVNWRQCETVCDHSRCAEASVRHVVINLPR
jgi:hypothetical protein